MALSGLRRRPRPDRGQHAIAAPPCGAELGASGRSMSPVARASLQTEDVSDL
ncbi:hypothetical protein RMHFA_05609 (plasmid) [Roseomonas mucosa]|nr:hypothetical protein RMHFA_05609 [Roseomonas mucosa]